jgi:hypothetical protein
MTRETLTSVVIEGEENVKNAQARWTPIMDRPKVPRMSEQITLQVSDRVVSQATYVAAQTQRRVEEVLANWLEWAVTEMPVETLSNEEVLALAELQLPPIQQTTLSDLLEQNQEGVLDTQGRRQLDELMRIYEHGLLRKAQALRVAVQRGLREPLQS